MQAARGQDDIVQEVSNLCRLCFKDGLIQILSTSFDNLFPVIFDAVKDCKSYNSRMSYIEQKQGSRDLLPVKFAQLDQTELEIACPVVQKSLAGDRHAFGDVIERSKLQFRKIDAYRGFGNWIFLSRCAI